MLFACEESAKLVHTLLAIFYIVYITAKKVEQDIQDIEHKQNTFKTFVNLL